MNCDRAGELLGTYLRDELTASTRAEVQAHLDHCAPCRADLDTYRLVFELPRVEPSAALHDRIFSSPEFQEIARAVSLHHSLNTDERLTESRSSADRPAPVGDKISANSAYSHLKIVRPSVPPPHAVSNGNGHHRPAGVAQGAIRRIDWQRAALRLAVAAAVLVLVLGSALAAKNLLQTQPTTARTPSFVLSGPVNGPLAAGNRVVYLHDGRLWSAPESGPQIRLPLTNEQVMVAPGWAVAPAADSAGVHHLAYIDLKTGTLHIIQTDDRGDLTVGRVAPSGANAAFWQGDEGKAILAGLAWAPDARQLAFVADRDGAGAALWVVNADGSASRPVSGAATPGAWPVLPAWASDGSNLAFALAQNGVTSIWDYTFDGNQRHLLEQRASPQGNVSDVVHGLFWTTDTLNPTITWSAGTPDGKVITGLWSYRLNQTPHLVHLTPLGASFSAVDYS